MNGPLCLTLLCLLSVAIAQQNVSLFPRSTNDGYIRIAGPSLIRGPLVTIQLRSDAVGATTPVASFTSESASLARDLYDNGTVAGAGAGAMMTGATGVLIEATTGNISTSAAAGFTATVGTAEALTVNSTGAYVPALFTPSISTNGGESLRLAASTGILMLYSTDAAATVDFMAGATTLYSISSDTFSATNALTMSAAGNITFTSTEDTGVGNYAELISPDGLNWIRVNNSGIFTSGLILVPFADVLFSNTTLDLIGDTGVIFRTDTSGTIQVLSGDLEMAAGKFFCSEEGTDTLLQAPDGRNITFQVQGTTLATFYDSGMELAELGGSTRGVQLLAPALSLESTAGGNVVVQSGSTMADIVFEQGTAPLLTFSTDLIEQGSADPFTTTSLSLGGDLVHTGSSATFNSDITVATGGSVTSDTSLDFITTGAMGSITLAPIGSFRAAVDSTTYFEVTNTGAFLPTPGTVFTVTGLTVIAGPTLFNQDITFTADAAILADPSGDLTLDNLMGAFTINSGGTISFDVDGDTIVEVGGAGFRIPPTSTFDTTAPVDLQGTLTSDMISYLNGLIMDAGTITSTVAGTDLTGEATDGGVNFTGSPILLQIDGNTALTLTSNSVEISPGTTFEFAGAATSTSTIAFQTPSPNQSTFTAGGSLNYVTQTGDLTISGGDSVDFNFLPFATGWTLTSDAFTSQGAPKTFTATTAFFDGELSLASPVDIQSVVKLDGSPAMVGAFNLDITAFANLLATGALGVEVAPADTTVTTFEQSGDILVEGVPLSMSHTAAAVTTFNGGIQAGEAIVIVNQDPVLFGDVTNEVQFNGGDSSIFGTAGILFDMITTAPTGTTSFTVEQNTGSFEFQAGGVTRATIDDSGFRIAISPINLQGGAQAYTFRGMYFNVATLANTQVNFSNDNNDLAAFAGSCRQVGQVTFTGVTSGVPCMCEMQQTTANMFCGCNVNGQIALVYYVYINNSAAAADAATLTRTVSTARVLVIHVATA